MEGKTSVEQIILGGIDQYIYVRTRNSENPLLLFLHGGPGLPEFGALKKMTVSLEERYTVVHWDQRGAGKSYSHIIPADSMTSDQLLEDARQLVVYLLKRFYKNKITLMGHSWGSVLGLKFAEYHPDLVAAYIGVNQVIDRPEEEKLSYLYIINKAEKSLIPGAAMMLRGISPPQDASKGSLVKMLFLRAWLTLFGGFVSSKVKLFTIFPAIFFAREYKLSDRLKILKGLFFSNKHLWNDLISSDFQESTESLAVPVYFIMGENDKVTFVQVVEKFLSKIKAPDKGLFIIPGAAHMCCFEKPDVFMKIIRNNISV